jgi:hypothetical protein
MGTSSAGACHGRACHGVYFRACLDVGLSGVSALTKKFSHACRQPPYAQLAFEAITSLGTCSWAMP